MEERPDPAPGPGQIRVRIEACGVCRTDLHVVDGELPRSQAADRAGARDRRPHRSGGRRRRAGARRAGRRGLARPYRRDLPLLQKRAREPVRHAAVHRLHPRRRLCHPYDRRGGVRLPAVRGPGAGRGRAAALRRPYRLALAQNGRGRAARSASMASAPRRTSSPRSAAGRDGACSPSPGPATPPVRRSPARSAPNGRADRTTCRPSRSTPPFCSRRSARWFRPRSPRCARAGGWSAAAST